MKQSEIDRELNLLVKAEAKKNGWKSVRGMPYWTIGPLFFVLTPIASAKHGSLYCSLDFKWLELDHVLWKILDMSGNEHAPFSLHANGAFALHGQTIHSISMRGLEWRPGVLAQQIADSARQAGERANEVAAQITSIHSYLDFIRREHEAFMQRNPGAGGDIWQETLLVSMATGDNASAAQIARSRIAAGDSGSFVSGGKTFFERAQALCETCA